MFAQNCLVMGNKTSTNFSAEEKAEEPCFLINLKGRIHCEIFLSRHFKALQFQGHFMKHEILS